MFIINVLLLVSCWFAVSIWKVHKGCTQTLEFKWMLIDSQLVFIDFQMSLIDVHRISIEFDGFEEGLNGL